MGLTASAEIEETLRLSADRLERNIATYRMAFFGTMAPLVLTLSVFLNNLKNPLPSVYFALCAVYGFVLLQLVKKHGAKKWLVYTALFFDMAVLCGPALVFNRVTDSENVSTGNFVRYLNG